MFCKNCGANLPDGTTFCGSCGTKQDVQQQAPVQPQTPVSPAGGYQPQLNFNLNNFAIGNVSGMRLIGIIVMAIIAVLTITKYCYLEMSFMGQSQDQSFNFMELFEDGFPGDDTTTGYKIFMYLIVFSNIIALVGAIGYIVFSFLGGPAVAGSQVAIQKRVLCSTVTLVALAVGLVCCFILPSPFDSETMGEASQYLGENNIEVSAGYGFAGWFALILAAADRFFVLPAVIKESAN